MARHAGTIAPIVALGGILLATGLDPSFSWTDDALSALGVRAASRLAFNGGLVLGGTLAAIHAVGLVRESERRPRRAVGLGFGYAALHLVGVGVFTIGHPLHVPAALGFYVVVTAVYLLDGIVRRETRHGRASIALAGVHVAIWAGWLAGLGPGTGLAIPEFAGALLVPLWIWWIGPEATLRADQSIAT